MPKDKVIAGLVWLGILLRVRQYVASRPLWHDEAMTALNICGRGYRELLQPLWLDQSAPIPFLWIERAATAVGGVNELALRALPFAAGLASVVLFRPLASRLSSRAVARSSLALVALSPTLVYFSHEVKVYGVDALIAVVMMIATVGVIDQPESRRRWWWLALAGVVTAVSIAPAPFVFAGVIAALAVAPGILGTSAGRRRLAIVVSAWAGLFLLVYLQIYRPAARNEYLNLFWSHSMITPSWGHATLDTVRPIARTLLGLVLSIDTSGSSWAELLALLLLIPLGCGAVRLRRERGWPAVLLCIVPFTATAGASTFGWYPMHTRLMLFALPPFAILMAMGVLEISERVPPLRSRGFYLGVCALLAWPIVSSSLGLLKPRSRENVKPQVMAFLRDHTAGDVVYVTANSGPAWTFYTTDWRSPDLGRVRRFSELFSFGGIAFRNAGPRGRAVVHEGHDLTYQYRDWTELIGLPPGTGTAGVTVADGPDAGWADNEAARIAETQARAPWVLFSVGGGKQTRTELSDALERRGFSIMAPPPDGNPILSRYERR